MVSDKAKEFMYNTLNPEPVPEATVDPWVKYALIGVVLLFFYLVLKRKKVL